MKNSKLIKGFTFIELIITITILAILATIGFMSYSSYISKSRDSNRVSQVSSIYGAMEEYKTKGYLPIPEKKVSIYSSGELIGYQGYITEDILNQLGYKEGGSDPKDNKYFTYSLDKKQRKIGILTMLENTQNDLQSDEFDRVPVSYGDKIGILLNKDNRVIQDIPTLLSNGLDVDTTNEEYRVYYSDKENISGTGEMLQVVYGTANTGIIGEKCDDYVEANAGYLLKSGYYLISDGLKLTKTYCPMDNLCIGDVPVNATSNHTTASGSLRTFNSTPGNCTFECNLGYVWDGDSCEDLNCGGTPPNGTTEISTAFSGIGGTWHYSTTQGVCTYKCNIGYSRVLNNCTPNIYTITYNGNGGVGHAPLSNSVTYKTAIGSLPSNPTRAGYTFNGWFTLSSGGTEIFTTDIYTTVGNSEYYAQWGINGVCGTSNGVATLTAPAINLCSEGTPTAISTTVGSYTWDCNGLNGGLPVSCSAPRKYTVTYDGNGGAGHLPISDTVTYNTAISSLPSNPTRSNSSFSGWYTTTTGGSQVTTSTVITGDVTFYSQWLCGVDYYEVGAACLSVGVGYYSPANNNTRTACTNHPDNASRNYTYSTTGGGSNNCSATYTALCGVDLYETTEGVCGAVGISYYSPANTNTRTLCSNLPADNASRDYYYTGPGGGINNCTYSHNQLCGVDSYESVAGTCTAVGVGYYSPANNNTRTLCTNGPANTYYINSGGGINNCWYYYNRSAGSWATCGGYIASCYGIQYRTVTCLGPGGIGCDSAAKPADHQGCTAPVTYLTHEVNTTSFNPTMGKAEWNNNYYPGPTWTWGVGVGIYFGGGGVGPACPGGKWNLDCYGDCDDTSSSPMR